MGITLILGLGVTVKVAGITAIRPSTKLLKPGIPFASKYTSNRISNCTIRRVSTVNMKGMLMLAIDRLIRAKQKKPKQTNNKKNPQMPGPGSHNYCRPWERG